VESGLQILKSLQTVPEAAVPAAVPAAPKKKKRGIGNFVMGLLTDPETAQLSNREIVDLVKEEFPEAKTTSASVSHYRYKLGEKNEG